MLLQVAEPKMPHFSQNFHSTMVSIVCKVVYKIVYKMGAGSGEPLGQLGGQGEETPSEALEPRWGLGHTGC